MQAVQALSNTHVIRQYSKGEKSMITRVHQIGNSKIKVHSPSGVICMTHEEQRVWFREQWSIGNIAVRRAVELAREIEERSSSHLRNISQ